MVIGVHWENVGDQRIDLDLSLTSTDTKIGWDGAYRSVNRDILISGDMTDAPEPLGASEIFSVSPQARGIYLMFVNYFNYQADVEVPFNLLIADESPTQLEKNYTIDPSHLVW